ncbi:YwiC-like family protein [Cellulomonas olei]|uniref:YwiC-like family protein n=1 Tax=Cellulomonas sp. P4 TaxID=3142533 RepID=UPI0031BBB95E
MTATDRPRAARRRRVPRAWVPNQHGAWAMVVAPPVVGALLAGPRGLHALLLAAWLAAYCAYFALTQWLRSGRRRRYRDPVLGYGVATAVLGLPLVAAQPALLRWAPAFALLLGASLRYAARRADRSYGNDLVTITAAALMTVVAAGLLDRPEGWWPPGADDPRARTAAGLLAAYLVGTVPYVKSMIRERGRPATARLSAGYHAALLAGAVVLAAAGRPAGVAGVALVVVAAGLLARAVLLPRRGRVRPAVVGAGEVVATLAVTAVTLAAV